MKMIEEGRVNYYKIFISEKNIFMKNILYFKRSFKSHSWGRNKIDNQNGNTRIKSNGCDEERI